MARAYVLMGCKLGSEKSIILENEELLWFMSSPSLLGLLKTNVIQRETMWISVRITYAFWQNVIYSVGAKLFRKDSSFWTLFIGIEIALGLLYKSLLKRLSQSIRLLTTWENIAIKEAALPITDNESWQKKKVFKVILYIHLFIKTKRAEIPYNVGLI